MDPSQTPFLIVLAVLLVGSAIASASETALFGISHGQRAQLRRTNPGLSKIIESLLARPRELLMQVLLLNMVVNVAYFIVTSVLTLRAHGAGARITISVVSLAAIILVGEVFAKLFASSATVLFLRFAGPMHVVIRGSMVPILRFIDRWIVAPLARLIAPSQSDQQMGSAMGVNADQLGMLIDLSARDGVIDSGEQELLSSIVAMGQLRVEQVMTPRVDIVWVDLQASDDEIKEISRASGRTRLIVCDGGLDQRVVGQVSARRVLEGQAIQSAMDEVLFIPEQARLDALMEQFRTTSQSIAVCVDEHGGVSGIVAIADVAAQLIDEAGDIGQHLQSEVQQLDASRWIVPARLSIRDWAMLLGDDQLIQHARHVNTIGGLVMVLLDRIPTTGDCASLGEIELRVVEMDGRTIRRVEVHMKSIPENGGDS